jgi:3-oxoacyl-[acyl-carrier protein] reductase
MVMYPETNRLQWQDMIRANSTLANVALVTGASRGIGKIVALQLAACGYAVGVNYRVSQREAEEVARAITCRQGRAAILQADVSVVEQAAALVRRAEEELGPLEVLVNNAGITRDRLLLQMSEQDWDATWLTNLDGPRAVARSALRSMKVRGNGRIINLGSVVGVTGNAGQANYAAAKAAVLGFTRQLAVEAAPYGVTVNCVVPGYIVTDATAHLTDGQQQDWLRRIPMRRAATPDEVADIIVFLSGAQASYITGQYIAVDGGLLAAAELA